MPNGAEHSVMVETFQPFQGGQHSAFLVLQGLRGGNSALQSPLIVSPIALSQLQPRCLKGTTLVRRKNYAKCQ